MAKASQSMLPGFIKSICAWSRIICSDKKKAKRVSPTIWPKIFSIYTYSRLPMRISFWSTVDTIYCERQYNSRKTSENRQWF